MFIRIPFVRQICWSLLAGLAFFSGSACKKEQRAEPAGGEKPWRDFSGARALAHVQRLVDFGPRPAASEAIKKSRDYITAQLVQSGWSVIPQAFSDDTPRGKVGFVNLIARFTSPQKATRDRLFLVCSHYDTKTFDSIRFVGANDGGSSTGALLEIARVLGGFPQLAAKVELVFFDGEEAYENFTQTDGLFGSRHFAKQLLEQKQVSRFRGGILLDMIGDRSLTITLSPESPAALARDIFAAADAVNERNHFTYFQSDITDDHTPLNAVGIPTIDLIDFDFPAWHTADDTMDKISAESLQIVGKVTLYYLSEFAFK